MYVATLRVQKEQKNKGKWQKPKVLVSLFVVNTFPSQISIYAVVD